MALLAFFRRHLVNVTKSVRPANHRHTLYHPSPVVLRAGVRTAMTQQSPANSSDLHAHNMYPNLNTDSNDPRIIYPYAERNKDPILNAITPYLQRVNRGEES